MLRALPNVTDEEALLDEADLQLANQDGSAVNIINDAEDWTWETLVEDTSKGREVDNSDNIINLL